MLPVIAQLLGLIYCEKWTEESQLIMTNVRKVEIHTLLPNTNTSITDIKHNPKGDLEIYNSCANCIVYNKKWFCHDCNESIEVKTK